MAAHAKQEAKHARSRAGKHAVAYEAEGKIANLWQWVAALLVLLVVCVCIGLAAAAIAERNAQVARQAEEEQAEQQAAQAAAEAEERATAERLAAFPDVFDWTSNVKEVIQYPVLQAGCETCSLAAMLGSMGYEVEATYLVDNYLNYGWDKTFEDGFVGNPYTSGVGFPPVMIACGNEYLIAQGSIYRLEDYSGNSLDKLIEFTDRGIPVMVWTTTDFQWSWFGGWSGYGYWYGNGYGGYAAGGSGSSAATDSSSSSSADYSWYTNEHCVLLVSATDDTVTVMDPQTGFVTCSRAQFESVYNSCGKFAVSLSLS